MRGCPKVNVPEGLRYSSGHGWLRLEMDVYRMGITDYAQDLLGEVAFVGLPAVGSEMAAGDLLAEIEARKATNEFYAPITGMVLQVNDELADHPESVNEDPYGDGWLCVMSPLEAEGESLMDSAGYSRFIGG